jgi:hypothetical protein
MLAALTLGCGISTLWKKTIPDSTLAAVNAIDDAVDALNNAQADWQQVLTDLQQKLTDDAQATIRNEVAVLASRSISQAGVELRCDADFMRARIIRALQGIRAELLGGSVPASEPALCQVVPIAVDRAAVPQNVTQLEFYGYDFDHADGLTVSLERSAGGPVDVTAHLARPTHYAMTLRFGAGGVQLDDKSSRFRLDWSGRAISTVDVIQPQTPVCESRTVHVTPGSVTFEPGKKGNGDDDFYGHGPRVRATVNLRVEPKAIGADVYMRAIETESDWTLAEGSKVFELYHPDPGWRIDALDGSTSATHSYTDNDQANDSYDMGSGGPVKRFVYVGDTDEDEAGRGTQVTVTFNQLTLVLVQDTDCVSDRAVMALPRRLFTDLTFRRLEPLAARQRIERGPIVRP